MRDSIRKQIRIDCAVSSDASLPALDGFIDQHLAVVGGFGFVGTWLAEMVAFLNDERRSSIKLTLLGRNPALWRSKYPHLDRDDIDAVPIDVRLPFELPDQTSAVVFAAGIADPRVQASEPQRVYQSVLFGLHNTLTAASRLQNLSKLINFSSGLVAGHSDLPDVLCEDTIGSLDFKRPHNLYAETRRAAEAVASAFSSQFRLPVTTLRAFTFLGPFQPWDAPWAINSFIRDALSGVDIRVHGNGSVRRTYLYGSDVASWLLRVILEGQSGEVFNIGADEPVSHRQAAEWVAELVTPSPQVVVQSRSLDEHRSRDFIPSLSHIRRRLGVECTVDARGALARSLAWQAAMRGCERRVRGFGL